jgi:hypothetical protein
VPGNLANVDFMVKDSKRFADSGGWGYAAFDYDAASDTFKPATTAGTPPQGNDAKCGFACHTRAKARDLRVYGVREAVSGVPSELRLEKSAGRLRDLTRADGATSIPGFRYLSLRIGGDSQVPARTR